MYRSRWLGGNICSNLNKGSINAAKHNGICNRAVRSGTQNTFKPNTILMSFHLLYSTHNTQSPFRLYLQCSHMGTTRIFQVFSFRIPSTVPALSGHWRDSTHIVQHKVCIGTQYLLSDRKHNSGGRYIAYILHREGWRAVKRRCSEVCVQYTQFQCSVRVNVTTNFVFIEWNSIGLCDKCI